MLMGSGQREARIHYMDGTFRLLAGDHVRCDHRALIPLDELRYWSVERQEAYADAAASLEAERRAGMICSASLLAICATDCHRPVDAATSHAQPGNRALQCRAQRRSRAVDLARLPPSAIPKRSAHSPK